MPEIITLIWTVKGEKVEHRAEFMLRKSIPSQVFRQIASRMRPPHTIFLDFRVIDGRPECVWSLYRFPSKGIGEGTQLASGVVAGEILP